MDLDGGSGCEVEDVNTVLTVKSGMQVETGVRRLVRDFDKSIIIFSEMIPSWLLLVQGYLGKNHIVVYVESECTWFRRSIGLLDRCAVTPFWDEMMELPWERGNNDRVFLVQGTEAFVKKVLHKVGPRVSPLDSLIAVSSGRRISSNFGVPGLSWRRYKHCDLGGVTSGVYQIGCTADLTGESRVWPIRMSKCARFLVSLLKVDKYGKSCSSPDEDDGEADPRKVVRVSDLLGVIRAPSVFSRVTGWVRRKLLPQEVGSALDIPVQSLEVLGVHAAMDDDLTRKISLVPPLKVVQGALQLLFPLQEHDEVAVPTPTPEKLSLSTAPPDERAATISKSNAKAVKSDDAKTDEDFWNFNAVDPPDGDPSAWNLLTGVYDPATHGVIFEFFRARMARQFARNVTASARRYLHSTYSAEELKKGESESGELQKDLLGMRDAIARVRGSTFWDWDKGSFPFFWRWQPEVKKDMRDGTPLFVKGTLPNFKKAQKLPKDPGTAQRIMDKVNKVRLRAYIAVGLVLSLTSYFCVPKGEFDIRIVYDLTACGLNEALWAPTFWMPTILNVLDCACHTSWFGDVDAGEMFLNYPLDEKIRPYAGVDVSWSAEDGRPKTVWERWTRMAMGLLPSPWVTTRLFAWAMEIIKGDRTDPENPFHWSKVVLNCPGMPSYTPSMPRLFKWNPVFEAIAGDCKTFVDDLRSIGPTRALCRAVTHRVETMMGYLGLQDATRKRRPDSQTPGEWTGSIVRAIEDVGLFVTVSQTKWEKAQGMISDLLACFEPSADLPELELKDLERKVGFLVHLAMAYPLMFPFMKSFYLTMNSWRPSRDENGWKLSPRAYEAYMSIGRREGKEDWLESYDSDEGAPAKVKASPGLFGHLSALMELFDSPEPTLRLIRGSAILEVIYVFGDASGAGFGATWDGISDEDIGYRVGIWAEEGDGTSSNYRELRNLVETLEEMGSRGELDGREIFMFTDNMVSETIASRGSSKSEALYDLVVRLFKLQMRYKCVVHIIHVAGTRMIVQGTDGLSRGDMFEGVMRGEPMLSYVPLHLGAVDVSPPVFQWIDKWAGQLGKPVELLSLEGWFERGHDFDGGRVNCDGVWMPRYKYGTYVWSPPPGVARFAIEELRQARQKRQQSTHIFVCPRLMYSEWRRHVFKISLGAQGQQPHGGIGKEGVSAVQNRPYRWTQSSVRILLVLATVGLPAAFQVAQGATWTIQIHSSQRPLPWSPADNWNLRMIRRANLDLFWSRESSTVRGIRGHLKELVRRAREYGRRVPLSQITPWEVGDRQGMGVAVAMLEKSLEKGRNSDKYMQFDTCRKLRSAAADMYGATSAASNLRYGLKQRNLVLHLEEGPTQTIFLERMVIGMQARMPKDSSRNLPMCSRMVKYVLDNLEIELFSPTTDEARRRIIIMTGAYMVITFGYSLRGNEGFWVDAERLCDHIAVGKYDLRLPHLIVPLLGRFKTEEGDRMHVFPIVNVTQSGIRIRVWVERLVNLLKRERKRSCPAFCDVDGYQLSAATLEDVFHPILEKMQRDPAHRDVIPPSINVRQWYLLDRSLRRGAENEALDKHLDPSTVNFVHRWEKYEKARGKDPSGFNMMHHYAASRNTRYKQLQFSAIL